MVRYDALVVLGGLIGYFVAILASTALVLLFFRLNARLLPARLLPGGKVTEFLKGEWSNSSVAPVLALGSCTLCEAILLRHGVLVVMTLVRDFLVKHGDRLLGGPFPFLPAARLALLSILLMLLIGALSVLSIWIASFFFNKMTPGIDELEEIAKGNLSVAILFAFVLFAVTVILNQGIQDVARALVPYNLPSAVNLP